MKMELLQNIWDEFILFVPNIFYTLLVILIGLKTINILNKLFYNFMNRKGVDATLKPFLSKVISYALTACLLISAAAILGIQTTSIIALLGSLGLAIGLALQGSLANFAGGVIIILFRPFKVGDYIDSQGLAGTVKEISIFHTVLTTPDNKVIYVPNGGLSNSAVTNFSANSTRRLDMTFGIDYKDDIQKARSVIRKVLEKEGRILAEPAFKILVHTLADSSVNLSVRMWVKVEDFWDVNFTLNEQIKLSFDANQITIPFPQRQVHLNKAE
jgi:small conductance mechanosensitive channel